MSPRMLVDPPRESREYGLLGCTGVTLDNGMVLRSNRRGHMDIDDPKIKKELGPALERGLVMEQKFHGGGLAGATCSGCGFGAFRWQASAPCPRCGGEIEEDQ